MMRKFWRLNRSPLISSLKIFLLIFIKVRCGSDRMLGSGGTESPCPGRGDPSEDGQILVDGKLLRHARHARPCRRDRLGAGGSQKARADHAVGCPQATFAPPTSLPSREWVFAISSGGRNSLNNIFVT